MSLFPNSKLDDDTEKLTLDILCQIFNADAHPDAKHIPGYKPRKLRPKPNNELHATWLKSQGARKRHVILQTTA